MQLVQLVHWFNLIANAECSCFYVSPLMHSGIDDVSVASHKMLIEMQLVQLVQY